MDRSSRACAERSTLKLRTLSGRFPSEQESDCRQTPAIYLVLSILCAGRRPERTTYVTSPIEPRQCYRDNSVSISTSAAEYLPLDTVCWFTSVANGSSKWTNA